MKRMRWRSLVPEGHPRWLSGLPFDLVTLHEACDLVRSAAERRERLVFATPNVSFLKDASRNALFRDDILRCQLSLVDGMPVVWLGRLWGIPFRERVAGSDLLEHLANGPTASLRVFFFGGQDGAASSAMEAVNARQAGLVAVGALNPGFGSIEELSTADIIDRINRSGADFLVVALGAARGHRWIERNKDRLNVPVISHLGAAINFIAGSVSRAPLLMQRIGLEWLWRLSKEPSLWRRYAGDMLFLAQAFVRLAVAKASGWPGGALAGSIQVKKGPTGSACIVATTGRFTSHQVDQVEGLQLSPQAEMVLELRDVRVLDSSGLGWIYKQRYRNREGICRFTVECDETSLETLQRWRAVDLVNDAPTSCT